MIQQNLRPPRRPPSRKTGQNRELKLRRTLMSVRRYGERAGAWLPSVLFLVHVGNSGTTASRIATTATPAGALRHHTGVVVAEFLDLGEVLVVDDSQGRLLNDVWSGRHVLSASARPTPQTSLLCQWKDKPAIDRLHPVGQQKETTERPYQYHQEENSKRHIRRAATAAGCYHGNTPVSFLPSSESTTGSPGSGSRCPGIPRH